MGNNENIPELDGKTPDRQPSRGSGDTVSHSRNVHAKTRRRTDTKALQRFSTVPGSKRPTVEMDLLHQKIEQSGLDVINIKVRNQEVTGIKLKACLTKYLRPTWAYFIDAMLVRTIPRAK
jgi:hypothetical protein